LLEEKFKEIDFRKCDQTLLLIRYVCDIDFSMNIYQDCDLIINKVGSNRLKIIIPRSEITFIGDLCNLDFPSQLRNLSKKLFNLCILNVSYNLENHQVLDDLLTRKYVFPEYRKICRQDSKLKFRAQVRALLHNLT